MCSESAFLLSFRWVQFECAGRGGGCGRGTGAAAPRTSAPRRRISWLGRRRSRPSGGRARRSPHRRGLQPVAGPAALQRSRWCPRWCSRGTPKRVWLRRPRRCRAARCPRWWSRTGRSPPAANRWGAPAAPGTLPRAAARQLMLMIRSAARADPPSAHLQGLRLLGH